MLIFALTILSSLCQTVLARNYISIISAPTVYPHVETVADTIDRKTGFARPHVTTAETDQGLQSFCAGIGESDPDIVGASRRILRQEIEKCIENGVADIIEIPIGYDAIVLVKSRPAPAISLNTQALYRALAKYLGSPAQTDSTLNVSAVWHEIDRSLPIWPIRVVGPVSGTDLRDTFNRLVIEAGCRESNPQAVQLLQRRATLSYIEQLTLQGMCGRLRDDGSYHGIADDAGVIRQVVEDPANIGVLGYGSFLKNQTFIEPLAINGVLPGDASIASGEYPLAQSLFLYVKKAHLESVPGLWQYLAFFTSEGQMGAAGKLVKNGLIPLPVSERRYAKADLEAQRTAQLLAAVESSAVTE
jgi:phosphate transport system substrate-binding protein